MKKLSQTILIICTLCLVAASFNSCCEKEPPGLDNGDTRAADSSYVAAVEAKQEKVILIEELTGVRCANCPQGARALKSMSDANPGRVHIVAMHHDLDGPQLTHPIPDKSKYDFRQPVVNEIISFLGGMPGLPSAAIDRKKQSGGEVFILSPWVEKITVLLDETTPVNIQLENNYIFEQNRSELVVKVAITENIIEDIYLTAYVIEDNIIDYQLEGSIYIPDYEHNHVFRDCITSVSGSSLNFADKKAGTVLQKRINFTPKTEGDNAWNLDNCKVLVFVHKSGSDQSILQAAELSLK